MKTQTYILILSSRQDPKVLLSLNLSICTCFGRALWKLDRFGSASQQEKVLCSTISIGLFLMRSSSMAPSSADRRQLAEASGFSSHSWTQEHKRSLGKLALASENQSGYRPNVPAVMKHNALVSGSNSVQTSARTCGDFAARLAYLGKTVDRKVSADIGMQLSSLPWLRDSCIITSHSIHICRCRTNALRVHPFISALIHTTFNPTHCRGPYKALPISVR